MDMTGSQTIAAPREVVWAALNDPEVLKDAIPGCQEIEKISDTEMKAKVTLKIGPVKATFNGAVTLENINAPQSYTIAGEGAGGAAGFAKGRADVSLAELGPEETELTYQVKADVGGKLAQLGSRLIDSTSKKLAGQFFERFGNIVAPPEDDAEGEVAETKKRRWFGLIKGKDAAPDTAET